jgi:peroxiredoxin
MKTRMKNLAELAVVVIAVLLMAFAAPTGYKVGDTVADFSLKNVDGKLVSLNGYKEATGFIIVFTGNKCPFAKLYEGRLNELNKKYSKAGIRVIAINANDESLAPEDSYKHMVERAKEKHYSYAYVRDEQQTVAKAFGASKTPQAFVVFKEKGAWVLKYAGAIDDNGAQPEKAQNRYVQNAVEALLNNQPVAVTTSKSVGCTIKWKQ